MASSKTKRNKNGFLHLLTTAWHDPVWSKIIASAIIAILTTIGGFLWYSKSESRIFNHPKKVFDAHIGGSITTHSKLGEGHAKVSLLYFYDSELGLTAAPINTAIYTEIVNLKPSMVRIRNYSATASIHYQKEGRVIEQVVPLYSLPLFNNDIYYLENDSTKSHKWILPSLDALAVTTQLQQGESLRGWLLFEMDREYREIDYKINTIFLTIENNAHESDTISIPLKEQAGGNSLLGGGPINIDPKPYDLSKMRFTVAPMQDLHQLIKQKRN